MLRCRFLKYVGDIAKQYVLVSVVKAVFCWKCLNFEIARHTSSAQTHMSGHISPLAFRAMLNIVVNLITCQQLAFAVAWVDDSDDVFLYSTTGYHKRTVVIVGGDSMYDYMIEGDPGDSCCLFYCCCYRCHYRLWIIDYRLMVGY